MDYGLLHIMDVLLLHRKYECEEPLLLTAVQRGDLAMVKLLLERNSVNPNARSPSSKQTPLLYAVEEQDHTHIVETLLQSGRVDVNSKGRNGWTPLMMALSRGIIPTGEALLKHPGIDVSARDDDGKAAYTHACHAGAENGGMITLLEKYGCSAELDNYQPIYLTPVNRLRTPMLQLDVDQQAPSSGFRFPLHGSSSLPLKNLAGSPPCINWKNDPIYFGSAIIGKSVHPCKIEPNRHELPAPCSVVFNETVVFITDSERYDMLPFNPDTMDLVCTSEGSIPAGRRPIKGGYEEDGMPLYHGMAVHHDGRRVPGMTSPSLHGCVYSYHDKVHVTTNNYEILCWK
ncbi:ankyrin [Armillaria gallica]|uniref:Ankyrin n=1 Tax=Armillaria gallica TaxID=47427 RepID=A0A2H3DSY6_ARMGA|nr:ankyrin [Armillaria gallica]